MLPACVCERERVCVLFCVLCFVFCVRYLEYAAATQGGSWNFFLFFIFKKLKVKS